MLPQWMRQPVAGVRDVCQCHCRRWPSGSGSRASAQHSRGFRQPSVLPPVVRCSSPCSEDRAGVRAMAPARRQRSCVSSAAAVPPTASAFFQRRVIQRRRQLRIINRCAHGDLSWLNGHSGNGVAAERPANVRTISDGVAAFWPRSVRRTSGEQPGRQRPSSFAASSTGVGVIPPFPFLTASQPSPFITAFLPEPVAADCAYWALSRVRLPPHCPG